MGMIGDEFATARKHLLENLEGNLTWRDPARQSVKERECAKPPWNAASA